MLDSFAELLLPDNGNTFLFDKNKPFGQGIFGIARVNPEPGELQWIYLLKHFLNIDNFFFYIYRLIALFYPRSQSIDSYFYYS